MFQIGKIYKWSHQIAVMNRVQTKWKILSFNQMIMYHQLVIFRVNKNLIF